MFLDQLEVINQVTAFVCRRNHLSAADSEDVASHVRLKLMEDDYAILRKFRGLSSLRTFLSVTIQRIFLDYRTAAWGKWRPSAEARRSGAIAILLEQLLGRDGYGFEEAFEILTTNHKIGMSREAVAQMAARLPVRVRRRFEKEDALADIPAAGGADAIVIEEQEHIHARRLGQALDTVLSVMPAQDRLVLRLRFEDGRSVADIASMLRLDQKPLYRRLDRLFQDLRRQLEARGIMADDVRQLTGNWDAESPDAPPVESFPPRPSIGKGADTWP
jgi:RNA polymerase sigma factor for flagellar operon FliA